MSDLGQASLSLGDRSPFSPQPCVGGFGDCIHVQCPSQALLVGTRPLELRDNISCGGGVYQTSRARNNIFEEFFLLNYVYVCMSGVGRVILHMVQERVSKSLGANPLSGKNQSPLLFKSPAAHRSVITNSFRVGPGSGQ